MDPEPNSKAVPARRRALVVACILVLGLVAAGGAWLGLIAPGGAARTAVAGNARSVVPLSRAEALAEQIPNGATIEKASDAVRFTGPNVSLVIVASPPNADMKFRIAGLTDPTIDVPQGAHITVELINGDSDMGHTWILGSPRRLGPAAQDVSESTVAAAGLLGDPTAAGHPAETISFAAPAAGRYEYYCPVVGHAAQGMRGQFVVQPR